MNHTLSQENDDIIEAFDVATGSLKLTEVERDLELLLDALEDWRSKEELLAFEMPLQ